MERVGLGMTEEQLLVAWMNRLSPTSRYEVYKDKRYYEETNAATGENSSVLRGVKSWQEAYVVLREYEAVLVAHKTVVGGVMPGDKKGAKAFAIGAVDGQPTPAPAFSKKQFKKASTSLGVSVAQRQGQGKRKGDGEQGRRKR